MAHPRMNGDYAHNPYAEAEGNGSPYRQQYYSQQPVASPMYYEATPRTSYHHAYSPQPFTPGQQAYPGTGVSHSGGYTPAPGHGRIGGHPDFESAVPEHHARRSSGHRVQSGAERQSHTRYDSHPGGSYRVEADPQGRRRTGREQEPRQLPNARSPGGRQNEVEEDEPSVASLSARLGDARLNEEPSVHPNISSQIITASSTSSTLDPRYQVRSDPKRFFKQGRVFSILWHENVGANAHNTNATFFPTQYGERVFSHIRRMVVVKEYNNCAWCFAIYTYQGRGVSKSAADATKHAIVYMEGSQPVARASEPRMLSKPLEVRPDTADHRLSPMSRLNFGKLFTVEHNVKVLPVGKITERSMPDFLAYARSEIWI